MLMPAEAAGLNIHGINPQLRSVIAQLESNRVVTLARAPNAIYNDAGLTDTVMTFTFPARSLNPGDMIRGTIDGIVINNNAGTQSLLVQVLGVQQGASNSLGTSQSMNITAAAGNPNNYQAFHVSFLFSVGLPNIQGNYVPSIGVKDGAQTTANRSTGLWPNTAFCFVGGVQGWITSFASSGAILSGGPWLTGSGSGGSAVMQRPLVFDFAKPVQISVIITSSAAFNTMPVTINAGVIEGL